MLLIVEGTYVKFFFVLLTCEKSDCNEGNADFSEILEVESAREIILDLLFVLEFCNLSLIFRTFRNITIDQLIMNPVIIMHTPKPKAISKLDSC